MRHRYHHLRLQITVLDRQNANSADSSAIQLQASATVLAMSKSILIVWNSGYCRLSGSELADNQTKLSFAKTQPNNAIKPATWKALIRHSIPPPHPTRAAEWGVHVSPSWTDRNFLCQEWTHRLASLLQWSSSYSSTLEAFVWNIRGYRLPIVWRGRQICRTHTETMSGVWGRTTP